MVACRLTSTSIFAVVMSVVCIQFASADDGQPIAIRHWPGGGITVETMWDLSVGIGVDATAEKKLPKKMDLNLDKHTSHPVIVSRAPNANEVKITEPEASDLKGLPNSLPANQISAFYGEDGGPSIIQVDGALLLVFSKPPSSKLLDDQTKMNRGSKTSQPLAIVARGIDFDEKICEQLMDAYQPALMVVPQSITKVGEFKVEATKHNTVAFAASIKDDKTRFVSLTEKPYEMNDELKDLFEKKEAACQASQKFFADLSVEQMNFKPNNGSHTPRWNPEHMMGCELVFFSQIYHAVDPTIPVMNLNPQQKPENYKFAHPDWTGAEEARQMHRVQAFTRRFAYLLDGMDLDKRAKGSRFWTPRKLLLQMVRHYSEHTSNVKKKMKLPGWPEN